LTKSELELFFSAAAATAADLIKLVKIITVTGLPSNTDQKAILAIWKRLLDRQSVLIERFHCWFAGKRICEHFRELRSFQVKLGRFRGPSHPEALTKAAQQLLGSLWRRTNVDAWQQGCALTPDTTAMSSLVESWQSVQAEIRSQFKRFPRVHSRIVKKILLEMSLVEGLCSPGEPLQSEHDAGIKPHPHLTPMERNIIEVLSDAGRRLTTVEVLGALNSRRCSHSESATKLTLAAMVDHGLLYNCKKKPRGYGLLIDPNQSEWKLTLHRE